MENGEKLERGDVVVIDLNVSNGNFKDSELLRFGIVVEKLPYQPVSGLYNVWSPYRFVTRDGEVIESESGTRNCYNMSPIFLEKIGRLPNPSDSSPWSCYPKDELVRLLDQAVN